MRYKPFKVITAVVLMATSIYSPGFSEENQPPGPFLDDGVAFSGISGEGFVPAAVDFFRKHISPIDGDRCPMYPCCSQYSLDAFHKHGFILGWIMTCDRLLRCGRDELSIAPAIIVDGEWRCYDPVEENDFWRAR